MLKLTEEMAGFLYMVKRQILSKELMQEFIKNPEKAVEEATQVEAKSNSPQPEPISSLTKLVLSKFHSSDPETTSSLTVNMPDSRYQEFSQLANVLQTDMNSLANVLIEEFLKEARLAAVSSRTP